jgi:putative Mn2+ efflux pump MntP
VLSAWEVILIALSLALDAFAVALVVGSSGYGRQLRPAMRLAFHFGWFQFMMPVIGWWAGRWLERLIVAYDHWVAFALLAGVGGHMLWEACDADESQPAGDPTRGMRMVALSVATSIDALAVGVSLAMIQVEIWYPSVVTGLVTGTLALGGVHLGNRLHRGFGRRIEVLGGVVLIAVGLRILWSGWGGR